MNRLILIALLFAIIPSIVINGQTTYNKIARDTIVTKNGFLGKDYLLNGKKLTLPVMQWFMSDYPTADDAIQVASRTDQLSVAGFSIGGVFALGGSLVYAQNKDLGQDMFTLAGIGLGAGFLLQLFSNAYTSKAVKGYNHEIKTLYKNDSAHLYLIQKDIGGGVVFNF